MPKENKKDKTDNSVYERRIPSGFHVEIDKIQNGLSVCVCGVCSVLDFGEECAILKLRHGKIKVLGRGLSISVYENKTAEIFGKVGKIELL